MQPPQETLDAALDRASEIAWWNRNLTKLTRRPEFNNADSFLQESLIERKGPYIELVDPPASADDIATTFLEDQGYAEEVIDALISELFGGDPDGQLYRHQAEMIRATERDTNSNIITVPTATGKTEAFLLPVLNDCLQTEAEGTKAIIIYPMKTLAVDQLNRILRYLDQINRSKDQADRITIGIWDGDTPAQVGDYERDVEPGSYIRGLECPRTERKLTINSDGIVEAEGRTYPWIKVTRNRVRESADILLTNPEAMDYAFVNQRAETRGVFGNAAGEHPVQHIVFDEAHVWRGIKGAAIRLLVDRLKQFYRPSDPQVSLVSATVKNPTELATSLTGEPEDDVNAITFSAQNRHPPAGSDFDRFEPATLEEILNTLAYARVNKYSQDAFESAFPHLGNAVATAQEVGLITETDPLRLSSNHDWLEPAVDTALESAHEQTEHRRLDEVVSDSTGRRRFHEALLEDAGTNTAWNKFVAESIPEVMAVADWFDSGTMGNVEFKHYDDLIEYLDKQVSGDPEKYLPTVLGFGRLAGVITEKYHSFLKPPLKVYWCQDCRLLSRRDICPDCGEAINELQFCDTCHHPFVLSGDLEAENQSEDDELTPIPLGGADHPGRCPGCAERVSLTDIEVPTTTLLSFMLTEMCRITPSEKVLVFSDSHSSAENVAKQIQRTEYGLMAASLYVDYLQKKGGTGKLQPAYQYVAETLRTEYWEPFYDASLSPTGSAYNMIEQLQDDVVNNADLYDCRFLFDSTLITSQVLYNAADNAFELAVGQALWETFAANSSVSFSKSKVEISALTRGKIHQKVQNKLPECTRPLTTLIDEFLYELCDAGVIHEEDYGSIQLSVEKNANSEDDRRTAMQYINRQREELSNSNAFPDDFRVDSGLFVRKHRQDYSQLRLLPDVAFCSNCYSTYPALPNDKPSETCFQCGHQLASYQRFKQTEEESFTGAGFADIDEPSPWALDHWAHDIMRPLDDGVAENDFVTVGIHKGNIPATVRGIIEEGFRSDDPAINIVSSTPTMELGVDIGTLDTVTQVGMPPTLTNYVQRSGRTGRSRGSSSLVVTTIRGRHPVDNHFYQDLSRFFNEFEPVRVPNAYEFDQLLAGHVVTEVMSHMARNPHRSNSFEQAYTVADDDLSVDAYIGKIREQLGKLQSVITGDRERVLKNHIHDIFGDDGVRVFEAVFNGEGNISLAHRVDETFEPLRQADSDEISVEDLTEDYGRLDTWLKQLGYLANYRSFGHRFPVSFTGYDSSISFESTGRLYDMFPGQQNGRGAVFPMGGRDYLVDDVQAGRELTQLRICTNEECDWPFQSYSPDVEMCPHCNTGLTQTSIYEVGSVHCRPAYKAEQYWNTRGLQTKHVELTPTPETDHDETRLFGLPTTVTNGLFNLTEFIYAFERRHGSSSDVDIRRAEASVGTMDEYGPVGRQFQATGIKFVFPKIEVADRLDRQVTDVPWAVLMVSLEQALQRAIAVTVRIELDDFEVQSSIDDERLTVTVVDGRPGGNGVAWDVAENLHDGVVPAIKEVIGCPNCHQYCEECLLLPRTPAFYLENDLLDKRLLQTLLLSKQSTQSVD